MRTKRVFSWKAFMNDCVEHATEKTYKDFISKLPSYQDWVTACEGKTREECNELGYIIVNDWCVDAQVKTYADDFLEKFPHAPMMGLRPSACRNNIYGNTKCSGMNCNECWNCPYEEEE